MPKRKKSITGKSAAIRYKIRQRLRREQETSAEREYRLSKSRARSKFLIATETAEKRKYRLERSRWMSKKRHRLRSEIRHTQSTSSGVPEQIEYILPDVPVPNLNAVKKEPIDYTEKIISSASQSIPAHLIQAESASLGVQYRTKIHLLHVPNLDIVKKEPLDITEEILSTSQNIPAVESSSNFTLSLKSEPIDNCVDDITIPVKLGDIAPLETSVDIEESSSMSTFHAYKDSTEPPPKRLKFLLSPSTINTKINDEFSFFGNLVATKIRSFTDHHLQVETQHRIMNMFEMEMKNLNEDSLL